MRVLVKIVIALVLLLTVVWFGGRCYLKRSVAQYDGTIVTGVSAPVEITFDGRGVPQIWAKTDTDAYFAVGWLHASERLFQMQLIRLLARGELSEVFGQEAYQTDEFQRRIGFARNSGSSAMAPAARLALQRYADGVNAWMKQAEMLPPELVILRMKPRPWTVEDSIAISSYQTWFSHELQDHDKRYQSIVEKLGMPGKVLTHAGHPWSPPTVPDAFADAVLGATRMRATAASNSWVVSPSRSSTKAALHASDPHLSIDQAPGLWYLAGLHSEEGLNIVGVTYGGGPFVVMGHNDDIAFSFTVASVDLIDYYDDRPRSTIAREEIRVKGEAKPRVLEVKSGARGVMINDCCSLHWAGMEFDAAGISAAALALQKAKTFDDFRKAVTTFGALDANWIYSDRAGNIGYQLGAPVPIRDYDTYVRQKADDPKTAWQGFRALEETPHALNPQVGYLASSNNQIVSEKWPYPIPGFYDPYRITRSMALLQEKRTPADMRDMQLDVVSGLALRWKTLAVDGAKRAGLAAEAQRLAAWDGSMRSESREATLFSAWWRRMPKAVFEDELGDDWSTGRVLVEEALTTGVAIDDRRTSAVETGVDISARAMREATNIADGRTWGEACKLVVAHPLGRFVVLKWFLDLNRGPLPARGDGGTLNANFYSYEEDSRSFRSRLGPSMRFVLDWADVDAFTLTAALGQSGNPFSPHYDDFLPMMQQGESWNVPFSREKVYAKKKSVLRLVNQ